MALTKWLKHGLNGGLDLLDIADRLLDIPARLGVQQGNARARPRRVADRGNMRKVAIRDHAQHHGVFDVDVRAEGAGEIYPLDRAHVSIGLELVLEQR